MAEFYCHNKQVISKALPTYPKFQTKIYITFWAMAEFGLWVLSMKN